MYGVKRSPRNAIFVNVFASSTHIFDKRTNKTLFHNTLHFLICEFMELNFGKYFNPGHKIPFTAL